MKRKQHYRRSRQIERIERKCDIILSELIILRQRTDPRPNLDLVIERLHQEGERMRALCELERDTYRDRFACRDEHC